MSFKHFIKHLKTRHKKRFIKVVFNGRWWYSRFEIDRKTPSIPFHQDLESMEKDGKKEIRNAV